jgi:hypothetical protein
LKRNAADGLFTRPSIFQGLIGPGDCLFPGKKESGSPLGKKEKRLDFFLKGVLIKVALNEYSFRVNGAGAEPTKKINKIKGKGFGPAAPWRIKSRINSF